MSKVDKRRIGDPAAPLWRLNRAAKPLAVIIPVFFVVTAVVSTRHWFEVGDEPGIIGSIVGISLAILTIVSAVVAWSIYWLALARAVRDVREHSPGSLVRGVRLPKLAADVLAQSWPPEIVPALAPQKVVLRVDSAGVVFFDLATPPSPILEIHWRQIRTFEAIEYVESGVAYEGLAVVGPSEESVIVLQVVELKLPLVRFPQGEALVEIAQHATALRPLRGSSA
jgi:hypothetical protein